ncbi:hypothetical protein QCN29_09790 [Streptomyces sp. HNM0663]|uniref:Uncharacterized protein n=1 Tax=Streptomyces chengmaiensis TaxID=3040919 RepID=A0ABT6HK08_9ACTN|nr:hypothetical protein [Streptomyces chengmaiensis]MDH2389077.1 hypothetical protein [Streptomyces chengmaiensis]
MSIFIGLCLVLLGVGLDRVWLYIRELDRQTYIQLIEAEAKQEINAQVRDAERRMRREVFRRST